MKNLEQFTNLYQVSKTLRFELIPVGKTRENIEKNGIIARDTKRAESYKKMKKTIDEYHKAFIDKALSKVKLSGLDEYYRLYSASPEEKKEKSWTDEFFGIKNSLRKEIVAAFKNTVGFDGLFKKDVIAKLIPEWMTEEAPDLYFDEDFKNFTTYFTGYHQNRENMYTDEEKSTAVAYRLINENLPKFIDNIKVYRKIKESSVNDELPDLCRELDGFIPDEGLDSVFSLGYFNNVLTQSGIERYNTLIGGIKEEVIKIKGINERINLHNQKNPKAKLPKMKALFKQILSDRDSVSWLPASFSGADDLFANVYSFSSDLTDQCKELVKQFEEFDKCDKTKIYIRGDALASISNSLFGSYRVIPYALGIIENEESGGKKVRYYSVNDVEKETVVYLSSSDLDEEYDIDWRSGDFIPAYFRNGLKERIRIFETSFNGAIDLLAANVGADYKLTKEDKDILKQFLDSAMDILHFVKPLYLPDDSELDKDQLFYSGFSPIYNSISPITKLYDMVRNYATKKPYSDEK